MRLAIVSHVAPPARSGQAVVLYRILSGVDAGSYRFLLSREPECETERDGNRATPPLEGKPLRLAGERTLDRRRLGPAGRVADAINLVWQTRQRARSIAAAVRQERCSAVVACTGDIVDPPAGYLASRLTRVPFFLYAFDEYVNQWTARLHRAFARHWAERMLRRPNRVIVPNEFLAEEYSRKYGAQTTVVHNPFGPAASVASVVGRWPSVDGGISIVYTGTVYHANVDAFRNLLAAIELAPELGATLHIYTAEAGWRLEQLGMKGRMVVHGHVDHDEALKIQREADILFLPLAFQSMIPEVIRTSAPGKLGEYLAAGRPVLAHVPGDSFAAWYLRKHGCGVVVDRPDTAELAKAIGMVARDEVLRRDITGRARERAIEDFAVEPARAEFLKAFAGG